jgi:predicted membrane channel-forming protein YqfA (hemolysin III family)
MHRKKHWILLPSYILIGVLSIIFLPQILKTSALFVLALIFWGIYSTWIYIENKKNAKTNQVH